MPKNAAKTQNRYRQALRSLRKDKLSTVGILLVLIISLMAVLAPVVAPYEPSAQSLSTRLSPPSSGHLLGTDEFGRDVLSRIVFGSRVSLIVGILSVVLAMIIGVPVGILCAYFGNRFDLAVMRIVDILMSFPTLVFGLMLVAALSPSLMNVVIAIAISLVPRFVRVARGPAISIMRKEYIESSKAIGASTGRIVFLHILPNIAGPIAIMATLWVATSIRIEAGLSFLGLGVQPPTPSWGNMLKAGMNRILMAPWMAIYPGIAIVISVLAFNLIGDGIRDFLDPKKQI